MKQKKNIIRLILLIVFAAIFCVSSYKVISQLAAEKRDNRTFEELSEQVEANRKPVHEKDQDEPPNGEPTVLSAYSLAYEQNQDLFGWIRIEDTTVNYPVMHTPDEPEHYLRRSFNNKRSSSGVPFLDGACFDGCGNYIVYGHNMKNGKMFAAITSYAKMSYWQEHPVINFDTLYEEGRYEVIAAFYSKVYSKDDDNVFRYYRYTDLSDPDAFEEYIKQVKEAALYDTGVDAKYGDSLLTLSTCEYHVDNGRFVVVAKKTEQ